MTREDRSDLIQEEQEAQVQPEALALSRKMLKNVVLSLDLKLGGVLQAKSAAMA